jgi:hypothetical protein
MALRLLGMTTSELKDIDSKVISGRQYIGGIKSDINKIINDFNTSLVPANIAKANTQPAGSVIQPNQPAHIPVAPISTPVHAPIVIQAQPIASDHNPDQLELDFFRKIKPEDIEYQLKLVDNSLKDLSCKLDLVLELVKKNLIDKNGN